MTYTIVIARITKGKNFSLVDIKYDRIGKNQFFQELINGDDIKTKTSDYSFHYNVESYNFTTKPDCMQAFRMLESQAKDYDNAEHCLIWTLLTETEVVKWEKSIHNPNSKTKTIQIISDVHTEFGMQPERFRSFLDKADITVLAGDIVNSASKLPEFLMICKEFSKYVVFVCGNHEYYKSYTDSDYEAACNSIPGVFFLQRKRVQIEGLWFAGCTLWTDVDDYANKMMRDPFNASEIRAMHGKDRDWLDRTVMEGDIVITHHLPSCQLIHPKYANSTLNSGFATDLDWLIEKLKPNLWICGHTHTPFDIEVSGCRIVVNPVGYPGENPLFKKQIINQNLSTPSTHPK